MERSPQMICIVLICLQGVLCRKLHPRMMLESVYPEKGTGSGTSGHGGPMNQWGQHMGGGGGGQMHGQLGGGQMHGHTGGGQIQSQMGGGQMSGFMGGPMGGPSGDPTNQQQHMQQSMSSSGSCVPSHSECACPNYRFHAPTNCYFCDCNGYQGQAPVTPTLIVLPTGSKQPVVNSTPPIPRTSAAAGAMKPTTTPSSVSQCQRAADLCLMNCPGGYLVDPDDCTFCVCKKSVMTGR